MPGLKTVAKLLGKLRYVMSTDSERKRVIVINKYTVRHILVPYIKTPATVVSGI